MISSIIQGNGGWGIGASGNASSGTATPLWAYYARANAWGSNTSGNYNASLPAAPGM